MQKVINATTAVVKAEGSKLQSDVNNARSLVNSLNASDKTALGTRLDAIQSAIDAGKSSQKFKTDTLTTLNTLNLSLAYNGNLDNIQSSLDAIKAKVGGMVDGPDKDQLLAKIKEIQDKINKKRDTNTKKQNTSSLLDKAVQLVSNLPTESQTALTGRLNAIKVNVNATEAVNKALITKDSSDIENAKDLVNKVQDNRIKNQLNYKIKDFK